MKQLLAKLLILFFFASATNAALTVTSVSPNSGVATGGNAVTISGTDLLGVDYIDFNGTAATIQTSGRTNTQMTVVVPNAYTWGAVDVSLSNSSSGEYVTRTSGYTYLAPVINTVAPSQGSVAGGTPVTISGSNFAGITGVMFGFDYAASFSVVNSTTITAVTSASTNGTYTGDVQLDTDVNSVVKVNAFTYINPAISNVSPLSGSVAGGASITLTGTGLNAVQAVYIGNNTAQLAAHSDTSMVVISQPDIAGNWPIELELTNGSRIETGFTFALTDSAITSVNQTQFSALGGESVVITGIGLDDVTQVFIAGIAATSFVINTSTQITAIVPVGYSWTTGPVSVAFTDGRTADSPQTVSFQLPQLTAVSASSGQSKGGNTLTITGSGFTSNNFNISFDADGMAAQATNVHVVNTTTITLTVPPHYPGVANIVMDFGEQVMLPSSYEFITAQIVSITPSQGRLEGGELVTIKGNGFLPQVKGYISLTMPTGMNGFSKEATGVTIVDENTITFITPSWSAEARVGIVLTIENNSLGYPVPVDRISLNQAFSYYDEKEQPELASISISQGSQTGGNPISFYGSGFQSGSLITIGGQAIFSPSFVNAYQIDGTTPMLPTGTYDVILTNPDGQSTTLAYAYHVLEPHAVTPAIPPTKLGDLAPIASPDGTLNVADMVVLERIINGLLVPNSTQEIAADIAPLNNPDGSLNVADILILQRAVRGDVQLGSVGGTTNQTVISTPTVQFNTNPVTVSGVTASNVLTRLYTNGVLLSVQYADNAGNFSFDVSLLQGANSVYVTVWDGLSESLVSNVLSINYQPTTLSGTLTQTALPNNTQYILSGSVTIPSGHTLTIESGVKITVLPGSELIVNGDLIITGTTDNKVIFYSDTSGRVWNGITINSHTGQTNMNGFVLNNTNTSLQLNSAIATISNCEIQNVYIAYTDSSGSISNCSLINDNGSSGTMYLQNSSPTIEYNNVENVALTLIYNSNPVIRNNTFNNDNVISFDLYSGDQPGTNPIPVITNNSFISNGGYTGTWERIHTSSYYHGNSVIINATNNWWGNDDIQGISEMIFDYSDNFGSDIDSIDPNYIKPVINYGNYKKSVTNNEYDASNYVNGEISANTTLFANKSYYALGEIYVPAGVTLTIQAGAKIYFLESFGLTIAGGLVVQGQTNNPVVFTAYDNQSQSPWSGIKIRTTAMNVNINHAVIEYASVGLIIENNDAVISNSLFTHNDSAIQIQNSKEIVPVKSPTLTGNTIAGNQYGIVILAAGSDITSPRPVITGNDIYGNSYGNLIATYPLGTSIVINVQNNYWREDGAPVGSMFNTANTSSTSHNLELSDATNASNKYVSTTNMLNYSATLNQSASWSAVIYNSTMQQVQSYTGTGQSVNFVWNTRNTSSAIVQDGVYKVIISATSGAKTLVPHSFDVNADNTMPVVVLDAPIDGSEIQNGSHLPVNGSISDQAFDHYELTYAVGANPINPVWIAIINKSTSQVADRWMLGQADGTGLANGNYTLRLTGFDKAGNTTSVTAVINLQRLYLENISLREKYIQPNNGDVMTVDFDISQPATIELQIYNELTGEFINKVVVDVQTSGRHTMTWNAKNLSGQFVNDDVYEFRLVAYNESGQAIYSPANPTGAVAAYSEVLDESDFNVYENRFLKAGYFTPGLFRYTANMQSASVGAFYFPLLTKATWAQHPITRVWGWQNYFIWNGRDNEGNLIPGNMSFRLNVDARIKDNAVIIEGMNPIITGLDAFPNIEVTTNPYVMRHSFNQRSMAYYRVNQNSYVTIKLLPPGVNDFNSPDAITIQNHVSVIAKNGTTPIDYSFEWRGYEPNMSNSDPNINNIATKTEGAYTFAIQAVSQSTGVSSIYRGVLSLYQ